jgi:hypothetical protein
MMDATLDIIDPLSYPKWDELLLSSPDYTFFHSSNWARVLYESYGFKPSYFTLISNKNLVVCVPFMEVKNIVGKRKGVSLPFSDYCAPICASNFPFVNVFSSIASFGNKKQWKTLEFRGNCAIKKDTPVSEYFYTHSIDLKQNEKTIYDNLRDSTRRNIKKAEQDGLKVTFEYSTSALKEFYRLNVSTRKRHGLPPQPLLFFNKLFEHCIEKKQGVIVCASYNNKVLGASIYLHFGKKVCYKYGASDLSNPTFRTNNIIMWKAILHYRQKGFEHFCFGKTEPANTGLRQFKLGWTRHENVLNYYKYDLRRECFIENVPVKTSGIHTAVFRMLPKSALRIIGSLVYRYSA